MREALTYRCPFCDREVRVGKPCSGCAKKSAAKPKPARKSWEQEHSADGLDLPDEDFDYDDFIAREFGKAPHQKTGIKWYWWLLAVLVLAGMITGLLCI
jgi:hypothetical protein